MLEVVRERYSKSRVSQPCSSLWPSPSSMSLQAGGGGCKSDNAMTMEEQGMGEGKTFPNKHRKCVLRSSGMTQRPAPPATVSASEHLLAPPGTQKKPTKTNTHLDGRDSENFTKPLQQNSLVSLQQRRDTMSPAVNEPI